MGGSDSILKVKQICHRKVSFPEFAYSGPQNARNRLEVLHWLRTARVARLCTVMLMDQAWTRIRRSLPLGVSSYVKKPMISAISSKEEKKRPGNK